MSNLDYQKSPKHSLQTWNNFLRITIISALASAVVLLLMAGFLT